MKPISLHTPTDPKPLRVHVQLAGPLAVELKALADEYQMDPSTLLRILAVDALNARKLRAVG